MALRWHLDVLQVRTWKERTRWHLDVLQVRTRKERTTDPFGTIYPEKCRSIKEY